MRPWVSIVTPVYTGWEFLEECALSVYLQATRHPSIEPIVWEWWIGINGHGNDGGKALQLAYKIKDLFSSHVHGHGEVHVVNLPRVRGKVEALNTLVDFSRGEWIAVLDCDDTWERNKLLSQRAVIDFLPPEDRETLAVVGTHCWYFGDMNGPGPTLPTGIVKGERVLTGGNPIINSSALIRRDLAYWEDRFGLEDYDLWLRLALAGYTFFNIEDRLVYHRLHKGSAFNGKGVQDLEGLLAYHRAAWSKAKQQDS